MSAAEPAAALQRLLEAHFPDARGRFLVEAVTARGAVVYLRPGPHDLRPGGTVSGPALMALADTAMWMAVMGASAERGDAGAAQLDPGAAQLDPGAAQLDPGAAQLDPGAAQLDPGAAQLDAVTSDLSIHFLRRPPAGPVVAHCQLLKWGRRLAVGDVRLYAAAEVAGSPPAGSTPAGSTPAGPILEAVGAPVAQATVSYALAAP